jgi:outer membrane protein assembly factor BamA
MTITKRINAALTIILLPIILAHAQQDSSVLHAAGPPERRAPMEIDTVIIRGNEKTKDYVIRNEMTLKSGAIATPEAMEFDRNRIYSLGLFTRVDVFFDTLEGQNFLLVDVSERWYVMPLPLFGFRDGDTKRPYYGAGVLHNNFRGRNQKLLVSVVFGYNPALSLLFYDPLLDRDHGLYFSANASYSRVRNRSERATIGTGDFDEFHYDINSTIGKRFTLYETAGLNLGYQIVEIEDYRPGRTVSTRGKDKFIYATLNYAYDSRDLREYPTKGQFFSVYVSKYGFGESALSFTRVGTDLRKYFPLPLDLTLAARAFGSTVSGGTIPTYARQYFGYGERIRGYYRTVFEGENIMGTTLELRFPLLKARTIVFSAIPIPAEFSVWRFGVGLALYGDAGVTWFRGDKLQLRSFASGYGAGIDFLLPYSVIARAQYAYNEYFKGQFIIDVRAPI